MPSPRSAKNVVNASTLARSATCGPMRTPRVSSTTTTGTKRLRPPATATIVAATADVATIARNEPVSTLNDALAAAGRRTVVVMSERGAQAAPATANRNGRRPPSPALGEGRLDGHPDRVT